MTFVRVIKSEMMEIEHVSRMGEMSNTYRISVRKPQGKSPLGKHICGSILFNTFGVTE